MSVNALSTLKYESKGCEIKQNRKINIINRFLCFCEFIGSGTHECNIVGHTYSDQSHVIQYVIMSLAFYGVAYHGPNHGRDGINKSKIKVTDSYEV